MAAVLDRRRVLRQEALIAFLAGIGESGAARLLAVFDWLAKGHSRDGFRGCPFTNAAVELPEPDHPARGMISAYSPSRSSMGRPSFAEAGTGER